MPPRILIAEDDELQSTVLQTALDRRGYVAETVADGLAAVCRLRTGDFDLALLDYHMPDVDGLTAARLLYTLLDEAERPRLIGVTIAAEAMHAKQKTCGEKVFDAVVSKRIGLAALLAVIDSNLASGAEASAARRQRLRPGFDTGDTDRGRRMTAPGARRLDPAAAKTARGWTAPPGTPQNAGQVQVVSLAAFKDALGPKWDRLAFRAMMTAEHIIKRRLSPADVINRSGGHSFVVWFNGPNATTNAAILASAIRELRLRFLADFGEDVLPDREAVLPPGQDGAVDPALQQTVQ